jgi:hypothetical protein
MTRLAGSQETPLDELDGEDCKATNEKDTNNKKKKKKKKKKKIILKRFCRVGTSLTFEPRA